MKRKVFAALLACVMTVSLAACGNTSDSSSDKSDAKRIYKTGEIY